jgi:glycerol-3-phosphate dehydrogenase
MPRVKSTRDLAIGGGKDYSIEAAGMKDFVQSLATRTGLSTERATVLYERYGTRANQAAEFTRHEKDIPLKSLPTYSRREISFLAQNEKILHLDDLLLRRSMLAMLGGLTNEVLEEITEVLGESLKWGQKQKTAEKKRTLEILQNRHGVKLQSRRV